MAKTRNKNKSVDALAGAVGGGDAKKLKKAPTKKPALVKNEVSREVQKPKDKKAPTPKKLGGDPISRAMKYVASDDFARLAGKYEGITKKPKKLKATKSNTYNPTFDAPSAPKESLIGEEPNVGQTRLDLTKLSRQKKKTTDKAGSEESEPYTLKSQAPESPVAEIKEHYEAEKSEKAKKEVAKRPTGAETVRNQSDKDALAGALGIDLHDEFDRKNQLRRNPNALQTEAIKKISADPTLTEEERAVQLEAANSLAEEISQSEQTNKALVEAMEADEEMSEDQNKNQTVEDINNAKNDALNAFEYQDPDFQKKAALWRRLYNSNKAADVEPAIEKLGLTDYFPTINQPIAVGSYSRKTLGSGNIYAASGFTLPMGILDARERAIQKAAKKKKKQNAKLLDGFYAKSAPQFQAEVDDMAYEAAVEYMEAVGGDLSILKDPTNPLTQKLLRDQQAIKTFGQQTIDLNTRLETLQKVLMGAQGESKYVPNNLRRLMQKYYSGYPTTKALFEDPDFFSEINDAIQSYDNMTHYADEWHNGLKSFSQAKKYYNPKANFKDDAKAMENWELIRSGNIDLRVSAYKKFFDYEKVLEAAKHIVGQRNFTIDNEGNEVTPETVAKYLMTRLATQEGFDHINTNTGYLSKSMHNEKMNILNETRARTLNQESAVAGTAGFEAAYDAEYNGENALKAFEGSYADNDLSRPVMVRKFSSLSNTYEIIPTWTATGTGKATGFTQNAKINIADAPSGRLWRRGVSTKAKYYNVYDFIEESKEMLANNIASINSGQGGKRMNPLQIAAANNLLGLQANNVPNTGVSVKYITKSGHDFGFKETTGSLLHGTSGETQGDIRRVVTIHGGKEVTTDSYFNQYGMRVVRSSPNDNSPAAVSEDGKWKFQKNPHLTDEKAMQLEFNLDIQEDQNISKTTIDNADAILTKANRQKEMEGLFGSSSSQTSEGTSSAGSTEEQIRVFTDEE